MNTKIEQRDPNDLRGHIHPDLTHIPEMAEASPEFLAIAAGVGRMGIRQPIAVDKDGRVLDDHSRTLLRCALRWQLKTVPVEVFDAANVPLLIIAQLALRRHLSKSAIAYLAYPLLAPAFEFARARMLQNIAKSPENAGVASADSGAKTVEDLGKELGIERSMLFEAKKVHELFADKKVYTFNVRGGATDGDNVEMTLRAWFEPKLLQAFVGGEHEQNRPLGLGGVIAGISAVKGDPNQFNPKQTGQLELFGRGLDAFAGRALKLSPPQMIKGVRAWLDAKDDYSDEQLEQLEQLGEALKAEARSRRKASTGN